MISVTRCRTMPREAIPALIRLATMTMNNTRPRVTVSNAGMVGVFCIMLLLA